MVQAGDPPTLWGELIVLPEQRSAVRAAERFAAVLTRPTPRTRSNNPLLLHGPPGVGKSAVVQTLVRRVTAAADTRTVRVLTATEFPRASSEESGDDLADLRTCDLLVIEELHHLKEPDHDAAMAVLDHRTARHRPTVLTADTGPANLTALPRRLTSRVGGGLVVRIDPPGPGSRKRLVQWLADKRGVRLTPDALGWLADSVTGIRPLTGAIETLRGVSQRSPEPLSPTEVREALVTPEGESSALDRIVARVCDAFRVKPKDLTGASRLRTVLVPRQVAMYLAREAAGLSLVQIGRYFGGRDHTTVLNAVRKVAERLPEDVKLAATVHELRVACG